VILVHPFIYIEEYASNDICHAGYPFALAVAFALKQRNALGFVDRPLYLFPEFMATKPVEILIRGGLKAEDFNEDGIGDTPYSIDSDKDKYPLMEHWENYFALPPSVFDTGPSENPYPSIFGTHNGTITPHKTLHLPL